LSGANTSNEQAAECDHTAQFYKKNKWKLCFCLKAQLSNKQFQRIRTEKADGKQQ